MKIAFFSDCYLDLTGGIVSAINAQREALIGLGHEVYIFTTAYPKTKSELKRLAKSHIFVVPSCKYCFRGLTPVSRRPKIIEKWLLNNFPELRSFDVFYSHYESGCSIAGLRLGKSLHIPTIQVMHGREDIGESNIIPYGFRTITALLLNWFHSWYIPHPIKIPRDNYLATTIARSKMWELMVCHANFADLVLTPSEHFRKKLLHYHVTKEIKVLPNSFADDKFPEVKDPKVLNEDEELKIVWHSRVTPEKRIVPFLEALTMVTGKYRLDVYGEGVDLARAKKYAKDHHINAIFHGTVPFDKFTKALADSHLDVLVSYDCDTFGMTLIEAEAYGTPVLFCDPDMKEIVPNGGYVLTNTPDPSDMASAINDLIKHPTKIQQMSEVMLSHRNEVSASNRIKKLLEICATITS